MDGQKLLNSFILFILCFFSIRSYGVDLQIVNLNEDAANGYCLPRVKSSAKEIVKRNKATLFTGKTSQKGATNLRKLRNFNDARFQAVAKVLGTVEQLGKGKYKAQHGVKIVFGRKKKQASRQVRDHIQINPKEHAEHKMRVKKHGGTNNVALIAHELGHYIGNRDNRRIFKAYTNYVKGRCQISSYVTKKKSRSEEYAETFAAYITNPGLFKGLNCRKAFKFWVKQFGEKSINRSCESRRKSGQR